MREVPRALVTDDDGIDSPGLSALAAAARAARLDVVVAAPHRDCSGVGTSVASVRDGSRTALHPRELPGLADVEAWAVEGHPAYIVHVGRSRSGSTRNRTSSSPGSTSAPTSVTPCCTPARSARH